MANPDPSSRGKWLWLLVIALLAILLVVFVANPSGDRDGQVEDPIVTEEFGGEGAMVEEDAGSAGEIPAPEPFAPGGDPE